MKSDTLVKLWQRLPQSPDDTRSFIPCDAESINFAKPVFFCLGGGGTTTEREANGFAKLVEKILGGSEIYNLGTQLVTLHYKELDHENYIFDDAERYATSLAEQIFCRGNIIPDLHSLSAQKRRDAIECCENVLSNINVVASSLGTRIMPFIHDYMTETMLERGFTDEEAARARSNMHVLCFGDTGMQSQSILSAHRYGNPRPWDFTSIHFISTLDFIAQPTLPLLQELMPIKPNRDRILQFGEKKNVLLFLSRLPEEVLTVAKGKLTLRADDPEGHHPLAYAGMLTGMEELPYLSQEGGQWLLPSALQSAARRCLYTSLKGERGNAAALLQPLELTSRSPTLYMPVFEAYGYTERIENLLHNSTTLSHIPLRQKFLNKGPSPER